MQNSHAIDGASAEAPGAGEVTPPPPNRFQEERQELERVLADPRISRSQNLIRFLSFICNKYFEGKADEIREYSIAVEALGRKGASYDSHIDPIVRVTAQVLRKKLHDYYLAEGCGHPLQIALPLGHYVPQFVRVERAAGEVDALAEPGSHDPDRSGAIGPNAPRAEARGVEASAAAFPGRTVRTILKYAVLTALAPCIFFAGYFLGQGRNRAPHPVNDTFQWGNPVWSDEFNGAAGQLPNPGKWTYDVGNQDGWGNHEIEIYCAPNGGPRACDPRRPNAFQDGEGHLVLRAQRGQGGTWTSARITTRGLKSFQYGRIEARMKLPVGAGLWPAFWMLGADFGTKGWPACGSVTIMENVSKAQHNNGLGPAMIRSTLHAPQLYSSNGIFRDFNLPNGERVDDGSFHTYGIIWSPGMIQFYVDDPANVFFVLDANSLPEDSKWVFNQPFYLLLSLAVGGDWPTNPDAATPNPANLLVDYIRVYKIPKVPAPTIQWQPVDVKAGSSIASIIKLQAAGDSGRVLLSCSTEPATARCNLGSSVVDFSSTLAQEDSLTISTNQLTDNGRVAALPGHYKVTITATTMSGSRSQLTEPFEVKG